MLKHTPRGGENMQMKHRIEEEAQFCQLGLCPQFPRIPCPYVLKHHSFPALAPLKVSLVIIQRARDHFI